jgi:hypothetical protein
MFKDDYRTVEKFGFIDGDLVECILDLPEVCKQLDADLFPRQ